MKKKNRAQSFKVLTMSFLVCLIFSVAAFAAEKFVLSASDGPNLILRTFELDQNQIKTVDSNVIETTAWPIYEGQIGTAVTFRKDNNSLIFDVYYSACQDIDCYFNRTVSMKSLESDLQVRFEQDFSIPVHGYYPGAGNLYTIRLQTPSGPSLRLLILGRQLEERRLNKNGIPGSAQKITAVTELYNAVSEDGKMLVASTPGGHFTLRSLHAEVPVKKKTRTNFPVGALTLSGPVAKSSQLAGSGAATYRFLFFRTYHHFTDAGGSSNIKSRIMRQRIDDLTGEFIGRPKGFTEFKVIPYRLYGQSVTVTPGANVVFFTEFDISCNKNLLLGQVFNPQTRTKVGPPQLLIGCSELNNHLSGINGIDVAQFEP